MPLPSIRNRGAFFCFLSLYFTSRAHATVSNSIGGLCVREWDNVPLVLVHLCFLFSLSSVFTLARGDCGFPALIAMFGGRLSWASKRESGILKQRDTFFSLFLCLRFVFSFCDLYKVKKGDTSIVLPNCLSEKNNLEGETIGGGQGGKWEQSEREGTDRINNREREETQLREYEGNRRVP